MVHMCNEIDYAAILVFVSKKITFFSKPAIVSRIFYVIFKPANLML